MQRIRPDSHVRNSYSTTNTISLTNRMEGIKLHLDKNYALYGSDNTKFQVENNVVILKGEMSDINSFMHPFYIQGKVFVDARAFITKEGNIKDLGEFQLLKKRAIVELAWIENKAEFGSQSEFIADVFSSWFSNGVAKRLNMNMQDAQYLRIIAAIYYLHYLHSSIDMSPEEVKVVLIKVISKSLRVPTSMVEELIDTIGNEIISELYNWKGKDEVVTSVKLNQLSNCFNKLTDDIYKLNTTLIYTCLVNGSFIAVNSPDFTAIAIEHPPMFFLMVHYALEKGIQGKTSIGLTVHSVNNRHDTNRYENFMKSILSPSS